MKVANFSHYLTDSMERNGRHLPFLEKLPFRDESYVEPPQGMMTEQKVTTTIEKVSSVSISPQDKRSTIGNLPLVRMTTIIQPLQTQETPQKDIRTLIGYFVPALQARQYFWKNYRINLASLSSYVGCMKVDLLNPENKGEILRRAYGIECASDKYSVVFYAPSSVPDYDPEEIFNKQTELYYSLDNVAMLTAFFDLNLVVAPPPCALSLSEPTGDETQATILYYDGCSLEPICPPLPFSGLQGSLASKLQKLFRLMHQKEDIRNKQLQLRLSSIKAEFQQFKRMEELFGEETIKAIHGKIEEIYGGLNTTSDERVQLTKLSLAECRKELDDIDSQKKQGIKEAQALYLELVKVAESRKEEILSKHRSLMTYKQKIISIQKTIQEKDAYTKIASTMRDLNPHMSVLPAGITSLIRAPTKGPLAEALLRIQRFVPGQQNPVQLQLSLKEEENQMPDLMKAVQSIFGPLNLNWLALLGYVGLCKIYEQEDGYNINSDIETSSSTFWQTIRPSGANRMKTKGLEDWWRKAHGSKEEIPKAADLYLFVMKFFSSLNLPMVMKKKKGTLYGLTQISSVTPNHHGQPTVMWRFNPNLEDFIVGDNPLYMVVNHQAMFSYHSKELHLAPALQLYLEDQTRRNVYKGLYETNQGTLLTPAKDGYMLGTLAERVGLTSETTPKRNIDRLVSALETVQKAGVLKGFEIGRTRVDPYQTKIEITMADTYADIYHLAKMKRQEALLSRDLQKPFTPKKKTKKK